MNENAKQLIPFLRNLANSIESGEIKPKQLQTVGEFFMSYQFQEQATRDLEESTSEEPHFSQDELIKFLSMGWYIYQVLLKQETLPDNF
jgi:hypothetical protein